MERLRLLRYTETSIASVQVAETQLDVFRGSWPNSLLRYLETSIASVLVAERTWTFGNVRSRRRRSDDI